MQKKVTRIPSISPIALRKKRVAAYARVSSNKDAMLHSLAAQVSYYSEFIQRHPEWEYAGVFVDEGMTGTKEARPGFQQLMDSCKAGLIDQIITKSISRFARNTVTLLESVRQLKHLGISVYFEEQKTDSLTSQGELMLSLLACFAQEESRAASENRKWQIRRAFQQGVVPPLIMNGYAVEKGQLVLIPHEAETVKLIIHCYLSGMGKDAICRMLNELNIPTKNGGIWRTGTIHDILRNEKYRGDLLLQKSFVVDHISKKCVPNKGELPQYFIEGDHQALIDRQTSDRLCAEIKRRADATPEASKARRTVYPFTGRIVCEKCGKHYQRRHNNGKIAWQCSTYMQHGKKFCDAKQVHEQILIDKSAAVLGLQNFDEQVFQKRIREIRILPDNHLLFVFYDGTSEECAWTVPSRRDSWTEEMREKARQNSMRRYSK